VSQFGFGDIPGTGVSSVPMNTIVRNAVIAILGQSTSIALDFRKSVPISIALAFRAVWNQEALLLKWLPLFLIENSI
jgi:hypothetical protein